MQDSEGKRMTHPYKLPCDPEIIDALVMMASKTEKGLIQIQELATIVEELKESQANLGGKLASEKEQVSDMDGELVKKLDSMKEEIKKLSDNLKEHEEQYANGSVQSLIAALNDEENLGKVVRDRLDKLMKAITDKNKEQLEEAHKGLSESLKALPREEDFARLLQEVEQNATELRNQNEVLQKRAEESEQSKNLLTSKIADLEAKQEEMERQAGVAKLHRHNMLWRLGASDGIARTRKEALKEADNELTTQLEKAVAHGEDATKVVEQLESELDQADNELTTQLEQAVAYGEDATKVVEQLESELDQSKKTQQELENKNAQLTEEIDAKSKTLQEMLEQLVAKDKTTEFVERGIKLAQNMEDDDNAQVTYVREDPHVLDINKRNQIRGRNQRRKLSPEAQNARDMIKRLNTDVKKTEFEKSMDLNRRNVFSDTTMTPKTRKVFHDTINAHARLGDGHLGIA